MSSSAGTRSSSRRWCAWRRTGGGEPWAPWWDRWARSLFERSRDPIVAVGPFAERPPEFVSAKGAGPAQSAALRSEPGRLCGRIAVLRSSVGQRDRVVSRARDVPHDPHRRRSDVPALGCRGRMDASLRSRHQRRCVHRGPRHPVEGHRGCRDRSGGLRPDQPGERREVIPRPASRGAATRWRPMHGRDGAGCASAPVPPESCEPPTSRR